VQDVIRPTACRVGTLPARKVHARGTRRSGGTLASFTGDRNCGISDQYTWKHSIIIESITVFLESKRHIQSGDEPEKNPEAPILLEET
jgi:hypothetical protein